MPKTPVNPEAERSLVGGLIYYAAELEHVLPIATPMDVHDPFLREVFTELVALGEKNIVPEIPVLAERFPGKAVELAQLQSEAPLTGANLDHLAEIIRNDSRKRRILDIAREIANKVYDDTTQITDILAFAESSLATLGNVGGAKWITNRALLLDHIKTIRRRREMGGVQGVKTGFPDLDERLGGLTEGQLVFIAAVPKAGKTSCAMHIALYCGVPCLFYTLEMLPEELADRELAAASRTGKTPSSIGVHQIRSGRLSDEHMGAVLNISENLSRLPLSFVWQSGLSVQDIRILARQYMQEYGLGLVIIDQLDKIAEPRQGNESDTTRIGRVTRALKDMARDLRVPVICLTQLLDKQVAGRKVPRPQHGDIRDSSHPDQDADVILYLWRPSLYWPDKSEYRNMVEIIIARARSSAEGSVWVQWEPEFTAFRAMPREYWPDLKED